MEFRDWLNGRLRKNGWSGSELARRMRALDKHAPGPSTVGNWRRGEDQPRRENIPYLARALNVEERDIWALVQPGHGPDPDVVALIAREIPAGLTPHDARLVARLVRKNIEALREWGEEEEAADEAVFGTSDGSSDEGARAASDLLPVQPRLVEQG